MLEPELLELAGAQLDLGQKVGCPDRPRVDRDASRVGGDEDDDGLRALASDHTCRLEPADAGHVDVEQDEIRLQLREEPDRLLAARGHADEAQAFCLRDEGRADLLEDLAVVDHEHLSATLEACGREVPSCTALLLDGLRPECARVLAGCGRTAPRLADAAQPVARCQHGVARPTEGPVGRARDRDGLVALGRAALAAELREGSLVGALASAAVSTSAASPSDWLAPVIPAWLSVRSLLGRAAAAALRERSVYDTPSAKGSRRQPSGTAAASSIKPRAAARSIAALRLVTPNLR